ncbi:MAG: dTMP kinase [Eubacteriales bacterium]
MNTTNFFAIEGIDGSGKTSQIARLKERFAQEKIPAHFTREPSDLTVGKLVRDMLEGRKTMDNRVIAALFAADRLDHILDPEDGMLAQLAKGQTVITDRYYFSSYAYNGVDMPIEWVISANSQAAALLRPTATIFLDLSPDVALQRISQNRESFELFETKERLEQVRKNYLAAFKSLKQQETVEIIDASATEEEVAQALWQTISKYYT